MRTKDSILKRVTIGICFCCFVSIMPAEGRFDDGIIDQAGDFVGVQDTREGEGGQEPGCLFL